MQIERDCKLQRRENSRGINVSSLFLYIFAVFWYSNKKTFVDGAVRVRRGNKSYA